MGAAESKYFNSLVNSFSCHKKGDNFNEVSPLVFPAGVEPTSSEPESEILSIELRERVAKIYYFL
ncbi:MAG: hypothetical protein K0R59_4190, partial [Sphingobacterium sp.]|nr:hypothetical protein [Sphingobacterium sp.]